MVEDEYIIEIVERAAGEAPDARRALERLRPRIRRARRRRAAMRGSAVLAVLAVLGGLVSRNTHEPSRDLRVGGSGTTAAVESTPTTAPPAPSTTLAARAGEGAVPAQAPVAADPSLAAGHAVGGGAPVSGDVGASSSTPVSSVPAAKPKNAAKPAPSTPQAPGTSAPPAAQVTSFDGQAGSIEVQYTDNSMNLQSVSPSPGWSVADTKSDGATIQVTFEQESGGGGPVDIAVHLGDDGKPVVGDAVSGLTGS